MLTPGVLTWKEAMMTDRYTDDDWHWGFAHSKMVALIWSPDPKHQAAQRERVAYAMALGKPIRLLVMAGDRLPEDVCAGYADVAVWRVPEGDVAQTVRQIQTWLREVEQSSQ
jgi:hypothetical protein